MIAFSVSPAVVFTYFLLWRFKKCLIVKISRRWYIFWIQTLRCDLCSEKKHPVRMSTLPTNDGRRSPSLFIGNSWALTALQATINSGIAQALNCFTCQDRHLTLFHWILLLRRFYPTLQGWDPPQFHTQFRPNKGKFPDHMILPSYSLCTTYKNSLLRIIHPNIRSQIPPRMADVLEVLSFTNAESAKRSILYRGSTTFCGLAPKNGFRKYISISTAPIAWLTIIPKIPCWNRPPINGIIN